MGNKLDIKYHKSAADFLEHTGKYLTKDEVRHGMVLGIADALKQNPNLFGKEDIFYCSINTGESVNAAAIKTPMSPVLFTCLSGDKQEVAKKLVAAVLKRFKAVPAIAGEKEPTDVFAKLWCKKRHIKILSTMEQRLYLLDKVNDVTVSPEDSARQRWRTKN